MAATPNVKVIYGKPMLPDLARVLACLNEKEIKFELQDMNKGMRMSQDILNLQVSSHGHTPVLIDGPDELFGSRKICRHVVEKYRAYGYQYLLGKDPLSKVSVEQWIKSEEHRFDPPSIALVFYLSYNMEADMEKTTQSEKKLEKVLNLYEKRLGESDFLAANYFTIADLYHLPNTYYLQSSVEYGHFFKERKNVSRWWKSISERKSWKEVVKKFEEEGLQFYVPATNSKTDKSMFSTSKNGIKFGPSKSSEISSKIERVKLATEDSKERPELTDKDKFSPTEKSKSGITDEGKEKDASKMTIEADTERPNPDEKDKASLVDKEKSGKTDETKEPYANKTEGDKEAHKPDDKDKNSTNDNRKMGVTDKRKESDANKIASEENKEAQKLGEKDKASSSDKENPVKIDDIKDSEANKKDYEGDKIDENKESKTNDAGIEGKKDDNYSSGKENVTKENDNRGSIDSNNQVKKGSAPDDGKPYANKTEGDKEAHKPDDKDKNSTNDNRKMGVTDKREESDANKIASEENKEAQTLGDKDKASLGDKENPVKIDDIKDSEANKKDYEGEKIDENKESKTNDAGIEGQKDDKYSSGKEKEQDVTKENDNRGSIDSNNQVKKGSVPDDGKDKISDNKIPRSQDEKEKAS